MSNIPEEAGKVAGGIIDAMKGQPALLALVIFQVMIAVGAYYLIDRNRDRLQQREMAMLERCFPTMNPRMLNREKE